MRRTFGKSNAAGMEDIVKRENIIIWQVISTRMKIRHWLRQRDRLTEIRDVKSVTWKTPDGKWEKGKQGTDGRGVRKFTFKKEQLIIL